MSTELEFARLEADLDNMISAIVHRVAPSHENENEPAPTLYQYTDGSALSAILEHRRMWATHSSFLNDYGEGEYIWKRLLTVAEESNGHDAITAELTKSILSGIATNDEVLGKELFVACFSEDPDALSQWRAYANNGDGYSIGFRLSDVPDSDTV
ncbi:MAG: DUF2971 domain-containing protein [Sandaracinaceae bacterium]